MMAFFSIHSIFGKFYRKKYKFGAGGIQRAEIDSAAFKAVSRGEFGFMHPDC